MKPRLAELIAWLNGFEEQQLPLEQLKMRLQECDFSIDDFEGYVRFADDRYQRNLVSHGPAYFALALCWLPGQASPIHDHVGASCGVCVIQGTATEERFDRSENGGRLKLRDTATLSAGGVCGSFDNDIHRITNNEDTPLVTLHIYSPFLTNFHLFDEETGEERVFADPVVEEIEQQKAAARASSGAAGA